ncbi:ankyrin repeat domain-containing protein 40-like isoform X2 [Eriocheir sinensis]|uniref:ankyrin repeat domain-containing protein 40-like isoform X2 n=1 Tax=Eriocheir sinensis TaxID=95602 RepID=UPI0021CA2D7F|nr:ankyrin repeat domain-containing protein 40-like isoform X2 [Eriocheir sinensis]
MDLQKQQEEKFREACCFGDTDAVMTLISRGVNVNSPHEINGWTGLHWACKRDNVEVVRLLLTKGADIDIENNQAQKPAHLTTNLQILQLLGAEGPTTCEGTAGNEESLPITPNYLSNPPNDYKVQVNPGSAKNLFGKAQTNGIESTDTCSAPLIGKGVPASPAQSSISTSMQDILPRQIPVLVGSAASIFSSYPHPDTVEPRLFGKMVLKVRIANSDDPDFIEIDLQKAQINYSYLLTTCCKEMAVNPQMVERIRKLPNTRLRNDKDVQRLTDYTELELVMKGQSLLPLAREDAQSTSKNNYRSIHGYKTQTILY